MAYKLDKSATPEHAKDVAEAFGAALLALLDTPYEGGRKADKGVYVTVNGQNYILSADAEKQDILFIRTSLGLPNGTLVEVTDKTKITVDISSIG